MLKSDHLTIWRQCACMSQNFDTKHIEEEPKSDNNHRLQLFISKPTTPSPSALAALPLTSRGSITARGSSARGSSTARSSIHDQGQGALPDISHVTMRPSSSRRNSSRCSSSRHDKYDLSSKEIIGGHILWSFVSTPPLGNMFGNLHFMATVRQRGGGWVCMQTDYILFPIVSYVNFISHLNCILCTRTCVTN